MKRAIVRLAPRLHGSLAAAAFVVALVVPAAAHHTARGPTSGLLIPSLTHGAVEVLAVNRNAILALADQQIVTDPPFRRLRNFITLQHFSCFYEWLPST